MTSAPSQDTCQPWVDEAYVTTIYGADKTTALPAGVLALTLAAASTQLFHLAGKRYPGICRETIRPTCEQCTRPTWPDEWSLGQRTSGEVLDMIAAGWKPLGCGCEGVDRIQLPSQPVIAIVEVKAGATTVPTDEYRVDQNRYLVGVTGAAGTQRRWVCYQRLDLPPGTVGTFTVTYDYGSVIPDGGKLACAALAYNMALALTPNAEGCELGEGVTNIIRQGISISMIDPSVLYRDGWTGVRLVDAWLTSLRIGQQTRQATAYRLGSGRHVRTCC